MPSPMSGSLMMSRGGARGERYPLVEWRVTEEEALRYCYGKGFDWGGLYEIYHRCSCWCCPFQRIDELRKLRKHHPELWGRMLEMDARALAQFGETPLGMFRKGWTVGLLDARFEAEEQGRKFCRRRKKETGAEGSAFLLCNETGVPDGDAAD